MTSLRTLLFLVGSALVSGSEVKVNTFQYQPYSPYGIYRLPAEFADKNSLSLGNIGIPNLVSGIPNLASLVPFPISGISGYLPILSRGEKADCDHSGYITSGQPAPIVIPETPKTLDWIEPIVEAKPLAPIPEAPVLPSLALPEIPLKVEEPAQAYVPYQSGADFIETSEEPMIDEIKPLAPIPEAPVLPPFSFPDAGYYIETPKFVEQIKPLSSIPEAPCAVPLPIYVAEPEQAQFEEFKPWSPIPEAPVLPPFTAPAPIFVESEQTKEEFKPLGPIPEAPVLPPFSLPELPIKVSVPEPTYIVAEPEPAKFEEVKPLAPIPEAPVLPPFAFPSSGYWIETPKFVEQIKPSSSIPEAPCAAPLPIYVAEPEQAQFEEFKPWSPIPEAPVLPPFTAPAPIFVESEQTKEDFKPLGPIPEAPVLPPFSLPELPIKVSVPEPTYIVAEPEPAKYEEVKPLAPIPEAPVLPSFAFPSSGYWIETPKFVEEIKPLAPIPEAPVLGPYTLPELPLKVSVEKSESCEEELIDERKEPEYIKDNKLPIPEAPFLPPLTMPAIPTKVYEEPAGVIYIPELPAPIENNLIFEGPKIEELKPIPAAPELPPLAFNYAVSPIPTPVVTKVIEEPAKVFFGGFEYPKLASPVFCAHTVLRERVIPKFIEKEANYKVVAFSVGSELPFNAFNPGYVSYIPGYSSATYGLPVYSS